ncbi:hypothetical protein J6590_060295 [Homalodisca vitripennis]|nr:hypothetical protein J6590_060295 [Homalodisca vitripennis]
MRERKRVQAMCAAVDTSVVCLLASLNVSAVAALSAIMSVGIGNGLLKIIGVRSKYALTADNERKDRSRFAKGRAQRVRRRRAEGGRRPARFIENLPATLIRRYLSLGGRTVPLIMNPPQKDSFRRIHDEGL